MLICFLQREYGNIQTANFSTLVNCPLPRLRTENRKTTQVLTEANNKHTVKKTTNPDKQKAESIKEFLVGQQLENNESQPRCKQRETYDANVFFKSPSGRSSNNQKNHDSC